jgi:hypothetical protein
LILGVARKDDANYLDACRTKRRWWDASSLLGRDCHTGRVSTNSERNAVFGHRT